MIDTDSSQNVFAMIDRMPHIIAPLTAEPLSGADAAHWANNIFLWSSYLPRDCVQSTIRMGWHHST
jgi:hypothetical protein